MTYINDTSTLDGYEAPISLNTFGPSVLTGMGQVPRVPGNLTNFVFFPSWQQDNGYSPGVNFGMNTMPMMPPFNLFAPIATTFNVDLPGGSGGSVSSVTVDSSLSWMTTSPSTGGVVITENGIDAFCNAVDACVGTITLPNCFGTIAGHAAISSDGTDTLSFSTNDINYLTISSGADPVVWTWERSLFETFSDTAGSVCSADQAGALSQDLKLKGESGVLTAKDGSTTIDFRLDSTKAPSEWYAYRNISDGDTTDTADTFSDTITFRNQTATSTVLDNLLTVEVSTGDNVDFTLTRLAHAGLGAQLVKITGTSTFSTTLSDIGEYTAYTVKAFEFTGNGVSNANITEETTTGVLLDFSTNNSNQTPSSLVNGTSATFTANYWEVGTVLLAQKVAPGYWVTSHMPRLKATCS